MSAGANPYEIRRQRDIQEVENNATLGSSFCLPYKLNSARGKRELSLHSTSAARLRSNQVGCALHRNMTIGCKKFDQMSWSKKRN